MKMMHPEIDASADGRFVTNQLSSVLDALVAMRWDLDQCLRASPDLPVTLTFHLLRVGSELDGSINVLKMFIGEGSSPPQPIPQMTSRRLERDTSSARSRASCDVSAGG